MWYLRLVRLMRACLIESSESPVRSDIWRVPMWRNPSLSLS